VLTSPAVLVRKAVIPVAGRGTRFLPATRSVPKELLPIVDRPALDYVIAEAADAGISEVILVTAPRAEKQAIEEHFRPVESDDARLADLRALLGRVRITSVVQAEPLGLGHAVLCARGAVGDEPFAVLLPDDIFSGEPSPTRALADSFERSGGGGHVILLRVAAEQTHLYGIAGGQAGADGRIAIEQVVEKPPPGTAPSDLALVGRYVLPPEIFGLLERTSAGAGGEIQLTDALGALIDEPGLVGVMHGGVRHDAGDITGWLLANVAFGLTRSELRERLRQGLTELLGA
jgi:UTP--glucose-1-phosphate uridylyltransferase